MHVLSVRCGTASPVGFDTTKQLGIYRFGVASLKPDSERCTVDLIMTCDFAILIERVSATAIVGERVYAHT